MTYHCFYPLRNTRTVGTGSDYQDCFLLFGLATFGATELRPRFRGRLMSEKCPRRARASAEAPWQRHGTAYAG